MIRLIKIALALFNARKEMVQSIMGVLFDRSFELRDDKPMGQPLLLNNNPIFVVFHF